MKPFLITIGVVSFVGLLTIGGFAVGTFSWVVGETVSVAKQEFGPRRLLEKYEWFKDQAAALDAIKAKISVYAAEVTATKKDYGIDRSKWPRDVRQDYSLKRQEVAGLKAQFNNLAAEYNAQMAKFNWQFCNVGTMPEGVPAGSPTLPREYAAYITF